MACLWRLPLLLALWAGLNCDVLAGSLTIPVQVTFVEVAQHSASQTLNGSPEADPMQAGRHAPYLLAELQRKGAGNGQLSILVENAGDPDGSQSALPAPARRSSDDLIVTISYH